MNRISFCSLILVILCLYSCQTPGPERYFDLSVLNTNMMAGFARAELPRELEQPSVKLKEGTTDETVPMERKEMISSRLSYLQDNLEKLSDLPQSDDTRDIVQTSIKLHQLTVPVYENEYLTLAGLYDRSAPMQEIVLLNSQIHDKYYNQFQTLMNQLTEQGKLFASRHKIEVNWGN